jgi:hypothetical protein
MNKDQLFPICPNCGRIAEWADDEIYCEECYKALMKWIFETLSKEDCARIAAQWEQDDRLGVHLDRRPLEA